MISKQPSICQIVDLADSGKFDEAATAIANRPDTIMSHLAALCAVMARSFDSETPSLGGWRDYLDGAAAASGATVAFTTIGAGPRPFDWRRWEERAVITGDGKAEFAPSCLTVVSLGNRNVRVAFPQRFTVGDYAAVHLLADFASTINENFYLVLLGPEKELLHVRFGSNSIALLLPGIDPVVVPTMTSAHKLYSLVMEPDKLSLLLNGTLQANLPLPSALHPEGFVFELKGDASADLGAFPLGLEVWTAPRRMAEPVASAEKLLQCSVDELLESGQHSALYQILKNVRQINVAGQGPRFLSILDGLLEQRCYVPWIFECFLHHSGPEAQRRWVRENGPRLPKPIVKIDNLTIRFSRMPNRALSFSRLLLRRRQEKFNVLEQVDFELFEGDILGIIGENGAGKSTLLRALAGLIPISAGRIHVIGRHMLLTAGMGMRPEMTGRENIYLGGCFMGLTPRAMDKMADEIVSFAELEEAIDRPFKYYSDGMKSRLVFSLATSVSPDILMLDELLSAGDIKFQKKAARRMDELIKRANLVIVVTHGLGFVHEHCNKALYLNRGLQRFFGEPEEAIARYMSDLHMGRETSTNEDQETALHMNIVNQLNMTQFTPDVRAA